jgi:hypothetical protein
MGSVNKYTKSVFFNTESNSLFDSRLGQYTTPSQLLSYNPEDNIRLTLNQLVVHKQWYTVNGTNSVFFFIDKNDIFFRAEIAPGNYPDVLGAAFIAAFKKAIDDVLVAAGVPGPPVVTITSDPILETFELVFSASLDDGNFYTFSTKSIAESEGVLKQQLARFTALDIYNDSSELLGAAVNRERDIAGQSTDATLFPMFKITNPGAFTYQTYFPAKLNTFQQLFLRTASLSYLNLETTTLSQASDNSIGSLITSDILGSVIIDDINNKLYTFQDSDNNFSVIIQPSALQQLQFALCDSKGRLIPSISSETGYTVSPSIVSQAQQGNIYFEFSIKLDIV